MAQDKKQKLFVPPAVVKKTTSELPSDGAPFGGKTQYYQIPSNNEFQVLQGIKGHQQQGNVQPVSNIKRFVG